MASISIVVPVFNGARYLAACLASLENQDCDHAIEVIVVDDGSEDDSATIAEGFAGVRLLRRPHEGLAVTRNAGIAEARGDLIAFCDADDYWKPHKARVQADHLDAHPEAAVVLCRQDTIFAPGAEWPDWLVPDQIRGDLDGVSATSGMFRRAVFAALGGFQLDMDAGTDFNLLVRMRTAGFGIALIEDSLRVRRIHDDNMTTRVGAARAEMFQSVRQHLRGNP